jgi:hypothetical protein
VVESLRGPCGQYLRSAEYLKEEEHVGAGIPRWLYFVEAL